MASTVTQNVYRLNGLLNIVLILKFARLLSFLCSLLCKAFRSISWSLLIIEINLNTSSLLSTPRLLAVVVATRARTSSKSQTGQIITRTKYLLVNFFWSNDIQSTKCFFNKLLLLGFLYLMNMIPGLATRYSLPRRIQIAAQDRFGDFFI